MNEHYPQLFSPMILDGVVLKNRVVMAPMSTEYGGPVMANTLSPNATLATTDEIIAAWSPA